MDERAVSELRELERRDAELSARAERLGAVDAEIASLRSRAEKIDTFFATYPDAETGLRRAHAEAEEELARRGTELAEAEDRLVRARDEETRESARHALARAADHISVAEARLGRAQAERDELERRAAALPEELPALAGRAASLSEQLPDVPAPAAGPRELVEWASRAHASVFVAAGQIDTHRERLIREASELATMLLGEPTYGATARQALARVEALQART